MSVIKVITRLIYKPYLSRAEYLYKEALRLNGEPFNYMFFNPGTQMYAPKPRTKEFLNEYVHELAPVMNEKAIIEAYLLRFQNRLPTHATIYSLYLVPKVLHIKLAKVPEEIPSHLLSLVQGFQAMPEFNLIKKRLFIRTMYNGN